MSVDMSWLREQEAKRRAAQAQAASGGHTTPDPRSPLEEHARSTPHPAEIRAGTANPARPPRAHPLLHVNDLPRPERRILARGAALTFLGLLAFSAPMAVVWAALFVRSQNWVGFAIKDLMSLAQASIMFVCVPGVALWTFGLVILTPPVPPRPRTKAEGLATAHVVRGLNVGKPFWWPVAVPICAASWAVPLLLMLGALQAGGADSPQGLSLSRWAFVALLAASLLHSVACIQLREVALVVCDDVAATRALQTMFLLPFLGLLYPLILMPPNIIHKSIPDFTLTTSGFQGIFLLFGSAAFIFYPVFRFIAGVGSLEYSCRWSVTNDILKEAKTNRFLARARDDARRARDARIASGHGTADDFADAERDASSPTP